MWGSLSLLPTCPGGLQQVTMPWVTRLWWVTTRVQGVMGDWEGLGCAG